MFSVFYPIYLKGYIFHKFTTMKPERVTTVIRKKTFISDFKLFNHLTSSNIPTSNIRIQLATRQRSALKLSTDQPTIQAVSRQQASNTEIRLT